ncbi:MAG: cobalamin-binding protein [Chloroflexota bacterium]
MKKLSLLFIPLILTISVLVLTVTGCNESEQNTVYLTETTTTTITETIKTITITDDLGREVAIQGVPSRIVSLAPSNTEILYALGLEDKLVGVTEYCNYPEDALSKEKVGGFDGVDIEKVILINPDLILAEDLHKQEVIPALERLGFTVVALVPHNLQEVMDSITLIGRITGTEDKASQIVSDMNKKIKEITDETDNLTEAERPKVLYVIWHDPIMSIGNDTRIHELIEKAGGINIAAVAGEGYPTLSPEEIINTNPQVIMVNEENYEGGDKSLQFILNESRLAVVDAFINGKVYGINADLTNRPTPRIVEALELMTKMIHPEIFGSVE